MSLTPLKYGKYTANPMNMEVVKANGNLANLFTSIDRDATSNPDMEIIKLQFKTLNVPAYLLLFKSNSEARGIHFCEANEKGSNCSHATALAVVADMLGYKMNIMNIKTPVNVMMSVDTGFNEAVAENLNAHFGLLHVFDEEEESEPVANEAVPATSPVNSQVIPFAARKTGPRNPKKGWNEIQQHLQDQGVNAAIIHRTYELREKMSELPIRNFQDEPVKPSLPFMGDFLGRAIMHILRGKHLILLGDMGSGKDTLINTLAWVFNLPVTLVASSSSDTKETIVAEPAFKENESTYTFSNLAKSVQYGGIVNLSEANMLTGDTTSVLHSLFDENKVLATPLGAIPHHEHFLLIATLNIGSHYGGTNKLNAAFKDRFAVLRLPQGQDFKAMISRKTGLMDQSALKFLEQLKEAVEEINYEGRALDAKTYRGYEDAARFFVDFGFNAQTKTIVIEDYVINKEEDSDDYFALRDLIRTNVHSSFPVSAEEEAYQKSI